MRVAWYLTKQKRNHIRAPRSALQLFFIQGNSNLQQKCTSNVQTTKNRVNKCMVLKIMYSCKMKRVSSKLFMQTRKYGEFVGNKVKGRIFKRVFKKTKHVKFSGKQTFLTPWYTCVSRGKKCLFFGKFGVRCFLETPV